MIFFFMQQLFRTENARVIHDYPQETIGKNFSKATRLKLKLKLYLCRKFFALSEYNFSSILRREAFEKF